MAQGLYNILKSNSQLVGSILRLLSDQVMSKQINSQKHSVVCTIICCLPVAQI